MITKKFDEIPLFEISINPEDEAFVYGVALTPTPAHESLFLRFNEDVFQKQIFKADTVKQQVLGAAIIPNVPILRAPNNVVNEVHYVQFSEADIEIMAKEFFKNKFNSEININHTDEKVNAYFFQSVIAGDKIGQAKINGLDVPNGTWVLGAYIEDKETFERVAENGFSVEGLFKYSQPINDTNFKFNSDLETEFENELKRLISNLKNM